MIKRIYKIPNPDESPRDYEEALKSGLRNLAHYTVAAYLSKFAHIYEVCITSVPGYVHVNGKLKDIIRFCAAHVPDWLIFEDETED